MLARVLNPGVPRWVAVPCNVLAGIALVLFVLDPDGNLIWAMALKSSKHGQSSPRAK
jgi:hypothetical protein